MSTTLGTLDRRAHSGDRIAVVVDRQSMIRPLLDSLAEHSLVRDTNKVKRAAGLARIEYASGGVVSFHSRHARGSERGLTRDLVVIVPPTHVTDELVSAWLIVLAASPLGCIELAVL